MKSVSRTAQCSRCGSVNFIIKPLVGRVICKCSECEKEEKILKMDKYKTLNHICQICKNETFKFWIKIDKNNNYKEIWEARCINCKEVPAMINVNKSGVTIDNLQREILIKDDIIEEIKNEIVEKNNIIEELEYENEKKGRKINYLEGEIEERDYSISNLNDETYKLESEIKELEREINHLRY